MFREAEVPIEFLESEVGPISLEVAYSMRIPLGVAPGTNLTYFFKIEQKN